MKKKEQAFCSSILDTAYSPEMAVFNSCKIKYFDDYVVKMIIYLQGGILGTPYTLKENIKILENGDFQTKWQEWNSPLTPISRTMDKKDEWNF